MGKNKNKKLKSGFSLFEMIIVVALISIITGISFSYYGKYSEGKKLEGEAKKLANTISLALKKSSSGDQDNCNQLIGFKINFNSNLNWTLQRCCGPVLTCSDLNPPANFTLENNIVINSKTVNPPSNTILTAIRVNKLGSGILFNENTNYTTAVVSLKNNALESKNCINLNINQAGVFNIEER